MALAFLDWVGIDGFGIIGACMKEIDGNEGLYCMMVMRLDYKRKRV